MNNLLLLGAKDTEIILYIDNSPSGVTSAPFSVKQIIAENGNHWRKILTIFAKLVGEGDWKQYRDEYLLTKREGIYFGDEVQPLAKVHIFSGKACWQRFSIDPQKRGWHVTPCERVYYQHSSDGLCLCVPYLDYRQFPNALVETVRGIIQASH